MAGPGGSAGLEEAATRGPDGRNGRLAHRLRLGAANWISAAGKQEKAGILLIAVSIILFGATMAILGGSTSSGAYLWLARGFLHSLSGALLALCVWIFAGRRRNVAYLLLLGIACTGFAVWNLASGIRGNMLRLEANGILADFRSSPFVANGIAKAIDSNPYVAAYMVMRDAHWELSDRLYARMADYGRAYRSYVENGPFLDMSRLQSRLALWYAFYQVEDLEARLDRLENSPPDFEDLLWTTDLLKVDRQTREAYALDLQDAIAAARESQAALIERERETLRRIKESLKVLIEARGRYRFADGRIVFDDPADAARFAGKTRVD